MDTADVGRVEHVGRGTAATTALYWRGSRRRTIVPGGRSRRLSGTGSVPKISARSRRRRILLSTDIAAVADCEHGDDAEQPGQGWHPTLLGEVELPASFGDSRLGVSPQ